MGGLGNQMFQYAAGRAVAYRNNALLKLDISALNQDPLRSYKLHHFNIKASIATHDEVLSFTREKLYNRILHRLEGKLLPFFKRPVFKERFFHFDPSVLKLRSNIYMVGYWQSEKYFKDIGYIIREEFTLKDPPSSKSDRLSKLITKTNSVCLHVRRGDYVSNPTTYQYHGVCSRNYYESAVETLCQLVRNPHFFVFSDDIEWVKQNLRLNHSVTYIDHNGEEKDYEDLWLMSLCKHNIIANSSFSWWGAWLNSNSKKIVIAPKQWFKDKSIDTKDLIPNNWIKMQF